MSDGPAPTSWWSDLRQAAAFLTLVVSPGAGGATPQRVATSLYLFPAVGLLIGASSVAAGAAAFYLFGTPVHAVVAVAVAALVTGGLHLDGFADTCDAMFSWRDRSRRLEIMKDSRVGAMGVIALVLVIALKIAALLALGEHWWAGAMLAPAFGRWAAVYGIARFPAAKPDGLGSTVQSIAPGRQLEWAGALMALMALPLVFRDQWYAALPAMAAAVAMVHWLAATVSKSLGGLTGDVYGALSETGEVAALLVVCVALA